MKNASDLTLSIVRQATSSNDLKQFIDHCGAVLAESGLRIARLTVAMPALDPLIWGVSASWAPAHGLSFILDPHSAESEAAFRSGPIFAMLAEKQSFARWRLNDGQELPNFPQLRDFNREGITDYALHIVSFDSETALLGVAIGIASAEATGFTEEELARFDLILPAIVLGIFKMSISRTLHTTLSAYLGPMTADEVLNRHMQRGKGTAINAAILLVDLRSFTALSDRADQTSIVGWLDEHLEALGEPIGKHGGEILKFLGDGFLAIFRVNELDGRPELVCNSALNAAEEALARNRSLNQHRRSIGQPELQADIVLHFGEVIYGNVGTTERFDFTVIGQVVNEASRIEKLCQILGYPLLISESFAQSCSRKLNALGEHSLRGVDKPIRIWAVQDEGQAQ